MLRTGLWVMILSAARVCCVSGSIPFHPYPTLPRYIGRFFIGHPVGAVGAIVPKGLDL